MYKIVVGNATASEGLAFEPAAALYLSFTKLPGLVASVSLVKDDLVIEMYEPKTKK